MRKKKYRNSQQKGRIVLGVTFLLMIVVLVLAVSVGATWVSPVEFWQAWRSGDVTSAAYRIIVYTRLPRVLGALLAGSALAVCGSILQAVLQNPLASPSVIGINNGAGLSVLLCSALLPDKTELLPLAAFLGALATAAGVFALALGRGVSKVALVLTGIAISSILGAGMNCILILYPDAYVGASTFLVGGLSAVTLDGLTAPFWYIVAGLILAMLQRREMNIIALGSEGAKSLGMDVGRTRFLLVLTAAILAGAAVSFAGLISFVGLMIPHGFRFLIGSDNRYLLPVCVFAGAAFVMICDLASRIMFAPYELPVGILLSFLGGPFFIYLIIQSRRQSNA